MTCGSPARAPHRAGRPALLLACALGHCAPAAPPAPTSPGSTASAAASPAAALSAAPGAPGRPRRSIVVHAGKPVPVVNGPTPLGGPEPDGDALQGLVYFLDDNPIRMPDLDQLRPIAALFAARLAATPVAFGKGFPGVGARSEWFAIRYEGVLRVAPGAAGVHVVRVVSDDGAMLYVDGALVVDNDGIHPQQERRGSVALQPGDHPMRLDYLQGAGFVALELFVTPPGGVEARWQAGGSP
jgi:hypothetical protein